MTTRASLAGNGFGEEVRGTLFAACQKNVETGGMMENLMMMGHTGSNWSYAPPVASMAEPVPVAVSVEAVAHLAGAADAKPALAKS